MSTTTKNPINPLRGLSDIGRREAGGLDPDEEIFVRPYPFPFVAGLALSNDCDSQSIAAFEDWHGFVNGSGDTPYGAGLALEIGDSFWVWGGRVNGLALH